MRILYYKIRKFIRNVNRLIYWIPIIWNSGWWDWEYLLGIIIHQLEYMENNSRNKGNCEDSNITADEIKYVIKLLNNVIYSVYEENVYEQHYSKYGQSNFIMTDENTYKRILEISYPDNRTDKTIDEIRYELRDNLTIADMNKSKDLIEAFNLMSTQLFGWWD